MKFLKKAISLVLVFAMLASFAGMTGYKYSPMSIKAEAASSYQNAAYPPINIKYSRPASYNSFTSENDLLNDVAKPKDSFAGPIFATTPDDKGVADVIRYKIGSDGKRVIDHDNKMVKFEVPTTLYANNYVIAGNTNSFAGATDSNPLNSKIQITVPAATTEVKLHFISLTTYVAKDGSVKSNTLWNASVDLNNTASVEAREAARADYKDDVIFKTETLTLKGTNSDGTKNYVYDLAGENYQSIAAEYGATHFMAYRVDYKVTETYRLDEAPNQRSITYSQYAASAINASLPAYKAVSILTCENDYWDWGSKWMRPNKYQQLNYAGFLNTSGFHIAIGDTGDAATAGASGYFWGTNNKDNFPSWLFGALPGLSGNGHDAYTYKHVGDFNNAKNDKEHWLMGNNDVANSSDNNTSASLGATIYFDPQAMGPKKDYISLSMYTLYDAYSQGQDNRPDVNLDNNISSYNISIRGKGAEWGTSLCGGGTVTHTDITFPAGSFTSNWVQVSGAEGGYAKNELRVHKAAYSKNQNYFIATRLTASGKKTFYMYSGYYLEFIPLDRSASHEVIDLALASNYVKEEMSDTWWFEYRDNVLVSYFNCGAIWNTSAPYSVYSRYLNNPVYEGANYAPLTEELMNTPSYEVGNYDGASAESTNAYITLPNGTAWGRLGNTATKGGSASKTGADYYTEESWGKYVAARNKAIELYANFYRQASTYSYGNVENFQARQSFTGLYCYMQEFIDKAAAELKAAREALVLKEAVYTEIEKAITGAVADGKDTKVQAIVNNGDGSYNDTNLKFYHRDGDYTGDYYDADGTLIKVAKGDALDQRNFDATLAGNLRTALNKRLNLYDWTGADSSGTPTNLLNENLVADYHLGILPAAGQNYSFDKITDANVVTYEEKLSGTPSHYYLSLPYQPVIDMVASDINTAASELRLAVQPKKLGTLIEAAKVTDNGEYHEDIQADSSRSYIQSSYNDYKRQMDKLVQILKNDGDLSVSTSVNYSNASVVSGDYSSNDPLFESFDIVNADGSKTTVYPANRQEEYNYAVQSAQHVEKLLKYYADYTELLKRVNGATYIPEYDISGSAGLTQGGATWYEAESWNRFVAARNALVAMTAQGGTYNVNTALSNNGAGGYTRGDWYDAQQPQINEAVDEFDEAYEALIPKTLGSDGKWTDSGTDTEYKGYENIKAQLATILKELEGEYEYYVLNADGDLETKTAELYDDTAAQAAAALVEAYAATDILAVKGKDFVAALDAFRAKVDSAKANSAKTDTQAWQQIFDYLTATSGITINSGNIATQLANFFVDDGTIANQLTEEIEKYNKLPKEGKAINEQAAVNAQIKVFHDILDGTDLPAKAVYDAITSARNEAADTFTVYNPYNLEAYDSTHANHPLYNTFGDPTLDGIAGFVKYTSKSVGDLENAIGAIDNSYNLLKANVTEINTVTDTILANAGLKEVSGVPCLLVEENAKIDILKGALDGAAQALALKVTAVYPSDPTQNIELSRYTEKSTEELRTVYNLALAYYNENKTETTVDGQTIISTKLSAESQLEIDKLVFMLLDEIEDSRLLLSESVENDHWTWTYYDKDGNVATDENAIASAKFEAANADYFTAEKWNTLLHNTIQVSGKNNGLVLDNAYYGFLELELSTPYTDANGETVDAGKNWHADGEKKGWAILGANGKIDPAVNKVFDATWGEYATYYNSALDYYNGTPLTIDKQAEINALAQNIYNSRLALKLNTVDFTQDPNYATAKELGTTLIGFLQTTNVTRYGYKFVDIVDPETQEVTGKELQKSDNPLDTETEKVYIYNYTAADGTVGITPELEAKIMYFYAMYADDNPDAEFGSWETEGGGLALYNEIKNLLTTEGSDVPYNRMSLKKTDDETLTAGFNDLVENYIAGTWKNGVYTSTLLNSTQVETLNGKQGVTGLLPAAQAIITPDDGAAADATSAFGGNLAYATNAIFNYTKNPATNLQFAEAMKQQMVEFFGMKFTANVPDYYNNGTPIELYVFDQINANRLLNENVNPFYNNDENWPCIYEINNLQVEQGSEKIGNKANPNYGVYDVTVWPSGATASTGTGADAKIAAIFAKIGSKSSYYADVIAQTNSYHTDALAWIVENAIVGGVTIPGDSGTASVILADLNASENGSKITVNDQVLTDVNNAGKPIEQWADVKVEINYNPGWYADGYGCYTDKDGRSYYLYQGSKEIPGSSFNSWFVDTNGTLGKPNTRNNGVEPLKSILESDYYSGKNYYGGDLEKRFTHTDYNQIGNIATNTPGSGKASKYYADLIVSGGWTLSNAEDLLAEIQEDQDTIDESAARIYQKICGLTLLPATEAYRDVYNTYLSVRGEHIADANWLDESIYLATSVDGKQQIDKVDFTFYNVSQANKIANMDPTLYTKENPQYGVVSKTYNLLSKYDQSSESWTNMTQFIEDFTAKGDRGDLITIDQAVKVNTYGTIDGEDTVKKVLIDQYLSKLEFKEISFDLLYNVVNAFLSGNLQKNIDFDSLIREDIDIVSEYGTYYPLADAQDGKLIDYYYTEESLLNIASYLLNEGIINNEIVKFVKNEPVWAENFAFGAIQLNNQYKGDFEDNVYTEQDVEDVLIILASFLANDLDFNLADTAELRAKIAEFKSANPAEKYEHNDDWNNYIAQLDAAELLVKEVTENVDGEWDIRRQDEITAQLNALVAAELLIDLLADNYAPQMTLKTSVGDVKSFYSNEAYEIALRKADAASFTDAGVADPAAGTFFVPNSSGYSLIVYTNELNPRIVINLEDLEQNLAGTNQTAVWQEAAKQEYISINAKRTSGVKTNVIAGTIVPATDGNGKVMNVLGQTGDALGISEATSTDAVTVENNSAINGKPVKGSSAFAILAPTFVDNKATQAAVYTIEARDGSNRTVDGGTVDGNAVNQFDFGGAGQEPVDIEVLDTSNRIAIYVYYYSLKAADGTEEGINATGTALATPAIRGTNVPNALLSGEPGFKGEDWRNGILLQRHFSDSHRVWEYVSEIKQNAKKQYNVNGTQVPVYNDPTFGYLNTGSFYYVLDEKVAADAEVIEAYNSGNNAAAGCMDYDRATDAKEMMISKINAKDSTVFEKMKDSGRFYNYGDYETNEYGEVLTFDNGEPKWINWAQSLNNKVENGDLVFVHVVDRWGNVVNRIVEITNLDKIGPAVNSAVAGAVTIAEDGGSGLKDITVHNGDFSLGEFDYQINQSQNVKLENGEVANKAEVSCAGNELTIINLVPGKTYYIGAEDKAGNRATVPVKANADGHIVITIDNKIVQTGEDMGVDGNSSMFTLNGTDTIILNSGETSSVINADFDGNVFANRYIEHLITTLDTVTGLKTVYQDGTVEEWTSANAYIQNNGDGTLTWTIARKFAEGEHSYKVYAKVGDTYETFYAPANFFATTKSVRVTYRVAGPGSTVLLFGGTSEIVSSNHNSLTVPYGSKVTITAKTNTAGSDFYYWTNNTTDRIISTENVLEFKAVSNVDFVAQFTNTSTYTDGKKFVVYVNNAKNIIERFELADGANYKVPTGPVLPDYTFKGWSMTKDEVLESDKKTIIVEPIYELNTSNTVTITEGNYTATGAGTYTAEGNQRAVVTISADAKDGDGKDFLYWIDAENGEIVSYARTYTFFCVKDSELTPVYGDASTVKAEPIVRITEVKFNALSGKVSFFAERSVPEEYMILQTGIVVTKTEAIGTNEDVFVVGGTSTAAGTSTSTANNGFYSANATVATGQTVWARAYVIYENADGEIFEAYGPVVSYTVD